MVFMRLLFPRLWHENSSTEHDVRTAAMLGELSLYTSCKIGFPILHRGTNMPLPEKF